METKSLFGNIIIYVILSVQGLSDALRSSSKLNLDLLNNDMRFLNSAEKNYDDLYVKLVPKCVDGQTFCEDAVAYPEDIFYQNLKNTADGTQFFNNLSVESEDLIHNRFHEDDANFICPSRKKIVYPKVAYNTRHEAKFIYNFDGYRQGVPIEVCVKISACKMFDEQPLQFRTKCKQKFIERILLTADEYGKPYLDKYKFHSACVCSYKRNNIDLLD